MEQLFNQVDALLERYPFAFPLFFVAMWMLATTQLAMMSGWFRLQSRFPDQPETPIRRWSMASGQLGGLASYGNCLTLAVCPSGLRVGVWRIFGPFCRNFLVPWSELQVEPRGDRTRLLFGPGGTGDDPVGRLTISNGLAADLAAAASKSWPTPGAEIAVPTAWDVGRRLLIQWLLISVGASIFFTVVPRLMAPKDAQMSVATAILFPTLFFGAATLIQFLTYLAGRRRSQS